MINCFWRSLELRIIDKVKKTKMQYKTRYELEHNEYLFWVLTSLFLFIPEIIGCIYFLEETIFLILGAIYVLTSTSIIFRISHKYSNKQIWNEAKQEWEED